MYLVIGSGSIARRHISNMKMSDSSVEIGCVSASGNTDLRGIAVMTGLTLFPTLDEALNEGIRAAIIASPAPYHLPHAVAALRRGIPVLIEKPISSSMRDVVAYQDILQSHKLMIEIGYNLRFMPSARHFKKCIDDHLIGRICSVLVEVGQYLPDWRPGEDYTKSVSARKELGGGVLLELSHELDYLNWIFGSFTSAYCNISNSGSLDINVEDRVDAILQNDDGMIVNLHMDFLQHMPSRKCRAIGEKGTLVWDILDNSLYLYKEGVRTECLFQDPGYQKNQMYLDELERFYEVAQGKLKPMVDVNQAISALSLVEDLRRSSEERKLVQIRSFEF